MDAFKADEGQDVRIVAGPYVDRTGSVRWVDDLVACVRLNPQNAWDDAVALTFLHGYYVAA